MPNDPAYDLMVGLADVYLVHAFDEFCRDSAWEKLTIGNVPKVRYQLWVDALKKAQSHYEQLERLLS